MNIGDNTHNQAPLEHSAAEPPCAIDKRLGEWLRQVNRTTITPISLEINCAPVANWLCANRLTEAGDLLLLQELKTWATHFRSRSVKRIQIKQPFMLFDSASLTELNYTIAQKFRLQQGQHLEQVIYLNAEDVNNEIIALLKGLRFNHIHIHCQPHITPNALNLICQQISDFKFHGFSLAVHKTYFGDDKGQRLTALVSRFKPKLVQFWGELPAPSWALQSQIKSALLDLGYKFKTSDVLARTENTQSLRTDINLCMGPSARSQLGALTVTNHGDPLSYLDRINRGHLPVAFIA